MKKHIVLPLITVLILSIALLAGCGGNNNEESNSSAKVNAKIVLVLEDKTEVPYDISVTPDQSVRDALFEAGLITQETKEGMFVDTIDGHTADTMNDGVTWLACDKDGNQLEHEIESDSLFWSGDFIKVDDGDEIYLVYSEVPNFED